MNTEEGLSLVIGICIGISVMIILVLSILLNVNSDIGLSQEAGDLVCQKITNNTNSVAVDWRHINGEPRDSLICEIAHQRIEGGLIQVIGN